MHEGMSATVSLLLAAQNQDGAWGFSRGSSATEPAALALLALANDPRARDACARATSWLVAHQRPDGGWAPRPAVRQSTYVTSLALLALDGRTERDVLRRGAEWLLRQTNRDSSLLHRARMFLLGAKPDVPSEQAWSWFPNTAGWLTPTALAMLALKRWRSDAELSAAAERRLANGEAYLWSRLCRDGGWNHGSSKALGYEADSYPETTGQALLALQGTRDHRLEQALAAAERHLRRCRSAEGIAWLQLGLLVHGRAMAGIPAPSPPLRTIPEIALSLLAARARSGDHAFSEASRAA